MTEYKVSKPVGWNVIPPLTNINSYISAVYRFPVLTDAEEIEYSRDYYTTQNIESAKKLVLSHLRLVVSVARGFFGYGLPQEDLIQEGNIGLMKAVKKYNPNVGVRLSSFALYDIKSYIYEYIIRNVKLVKYATDKAHRKLFFNLRKLKSALLQKQTDDSFNLLDFDIEESRTLSEDNLKIVSDKLNIPVDVVRDFETRLAYSYDLSLDMTQEDDECPVRSPHLADTNYEPSKMLELKQHQYMMNEGLLEAVDTLSDRVKDIISARWLNIEDDTQKPSLEVFANKYNISIERVRQIESNGFRDIKKYLTKHYV